MIQCQNCGNANTPESQYCRTCGNLMAMRQKSAPVDYERQQPRPYAWKTDEYQTQTEARPKANAFPATAAVQNPDSQPTPYAAPQMFGGSYRCPHCMSQFLPRTEKRISTAGWITFAVLLVFFFPLFWIGLLIKENVHVCPSCNAKIQ